MSYRFFFVRHFPSPSSSGQLSFLFARSWLKVLLFFP
ncbi:hypothetical protein V6Z12_A11G229900 [Gossypium hirsutum]